MMDELEFVGFNFLEKTENEDPFAIENITEEIPGTIYWRKDLIIGFCSGIDAKDTHLIVGIATDGSRMEFKVNEPIEKVKTKLSDSG